MAILWASEGQIYQRFGYGPATLNSSIDVARERAVLRDVSPPVGSVRFVDRAEAARLFPAIYEPICVATPGFLARSPRWWENEVLADWQHARHGFDRKFYVVHERAGVPLGYAQLGRAGRTKALTLAAMSRADAMFASPVAPWSAQIF